MTIYNYLQLYRAPKLDLHIHLQGSGNLHVIEYLINKNRTVVYQKLLQDGALYDRLSQYPRIMKILGSHWTTTAQIVSLFDYDSINDFFATYKFLSLFINSTSDLNLYLKGFVINLIKQNIVYADVIVSLPELVAQGIEIPDILTLLDRFNKKNNIKINWWIDLVRHSGAENAYHLLKTIVQHNYVNIITGINLGGDEKAEDLESFEQVFSLAKKKGLKINIHDGETQHVANQEKYIKYGINRIAHGLSYIQEESCHNVVIEVCLSSNSKTKILKSVFDHPIFQCCNRLDNIVLCTDDSTLFCTNLVKELSYVLTVYGKKKLIDVVENSLNCVSYKESTEIIRWYQRNIE